MLSLVIRLTENNIVLSIVINVIVPKAVKQSGQVFGVHGENILEHAICLWISPTRLSLSRGEVQYGVVGH